MNHRRHPRVRHKPSVAETVSHAEWSTPQRLAEGAGLVGRGLVGLLLVLAVLIPGDSVAVEQGDALLHVWPALLAAMCAVLVFHASGLRAHPAALAACGCWIGLAVWMWISVLANLSQANVRAAINESWYWSAVALAFAAAAILFQTDSQRRGLITLLFAVLVAVSFHAAYQYLVTMPRDLELLARDPARALQGAGLGSNVDPVTRRIFLDRLAAREPMATFALANSLAGLLAPGIILAIALFTMPAPRDAGSRLRLLWIAVALFAGAILLLTKSRSAWLAALCGCGALALGRIAPRALGFSASDRDGGRRAPIPGQAPQGEMQHQELTAKAGGDGERRSTGMMRAIGSRGGWLFAVAGVLLLVGGLVLAASDRMLLRGAPQSVRVRVDYWRASAAMTADQPLVGVAPGNFQSAYSGYRLPAAHEQIADPHNFFFELAATGGIPAALFFIAAVVFSGGGMVRRQSPFADRGHEVGPGEAEAAHVDRGLFAGALAALPIAWIGGLVLGVAPDPAPYLIAVPLAVAVVVMSRSWIRRGPLSSGAIAAAAITLLVHLCTSGGVSVPGVLLPLALLAGADLEMWRAGDSREPVTPARRPKRIAASVLVALIVVTGVFLLSAWMPVRSVQRTIADAELLARQGRTEQAIQVAQSGAAIDPFDPAVAALAARLRGQWDLSYGGEWTAVLQQLVESAIERDPRNPAVYTLAADLRVLFYQRTGDSDHLRSAGTLYRAALERFPAAVRLRAQLALLERALGERHRARQRAAEATALLDQMPFFDASFEAIPVLNPVTLSSPGDPAGRTPVRQALANLQ